MKILFRKEVPSHIKMYDDDIMVVFGRALSKTRSLLPKCILIKAFEGEALVSFPFSLFFAKLFCNSPCKLSTHLSHLHAELLLSSGTIVNVHAELDRG